MTTRRRLMVVIPKSGKRVNNGDINDGNDGRKDH